MNDLFDLVAKTVANDREMSTDTVEKAEQKLTFKRDEEGILWSYDAETGKKVGRIYEHGDDNKIDRIREV